VGGPTPSIPAKKGTEVYREEVGRESRRGNVGGKKGLVSALLTNPLSELCGKWGNNYRGKTGEA